MSSNGTGKRCSDYGMVAIIILVVVTAVWVVLTPLVPGVATATMRRFHLRSNSFATWAIQFPIPTMYNFANTFQVYELEPDASDPSLSLQPVGKRYLNHFPMRIVTFANTRFQYLAAGEERWYRLESRYRGQRLVTKVRARPGSEGGFEIMRLPGGGSGE